MNKISDLINQNDFVQLNIYFLLANVFIGFILALILRSYYNKFGNSISNKEQFSKIFPLLTVTIVLIISIVKSSLALSLGLVGALSIVRFRTPIKEPEELNYLFLSIAIGLGMGSNQIFLTIIGISFIFFVIFLRRKTYIDKNTSNLTLLIEGIENDSIKVVRILEKYCENISLKRLTEEKDNSDMLFTIGLNDYKVLEELRKELRTNLPLSKISIFDNNVFSQS